ncbi:MAG: 16S rRNA (cytidine(1402)-2'-O)-methyltransferase [Fibrobacterales bacterium]
MDNQHTLYLVSTPIGNLEDMTFRAVRILEEASLVLAEDTRNSAKLLKHYEITTNMKSYHDFNKEKKTGHYIDHLKNKGSIALISDAGTPCVADPGFYIAREAIQHDIPVVAIPGASALLSGLVVSGMPSDAFSFEGFAPKKSARRLKYLEGLKEHPYTVCFYVSPYQVVKFLGEIDTVYGDITISLSRELTKKFEETLRGTPKELLAHYKERTPKGEFVLFFHPQNKG